MEGYRWLPPMLELPWLDHVLVDAPDRFHGGYSWYAPEGDADPGIERSRRELFHLLDALRDREPSPSIYLFGFSQGCLMTWEAGMRYPHPLAGCIGISGYIHRPERLLAEASPAARERSFLITHGLHDPLIPVEPVRRAVDDVRAGGYRVEWREFAKAHTIAGEEEVDLIRDFVRRHRESRGTAAK